MENETVRALPSNEIEGGSADEADVGFGFSGVVGFWGTFDDVGTGGMGREGGVGPAESDVGTWLLQRWNLSGGRVWKPSWLSSRSRVGLLQPRQPEDDLRRRMELSDEEIDRHEGTGGELNVESDPVGDDAGRGTGSVEQFQEVRVFERGASSIDMRDGSMKLSDAPESTSAKCELSGSG